MSDKKAFRPDDTPGNADWTKGSGPQDLGIHSRAELAAYLNAHHMTFAEFSRLPVYQLSRDKWRPTILGR
jgi:hypothetical protein